ncbi:MAG: guanylate kinase [Puniceicoccales bacterium]|jgi:guanylate kinase|nr:guanylate kinase [Puniceicoccales bacterium]
MARGGEQALIFIISGPAGVGKTTLCRNLIARCGERFAIAVTATTRPPRQGEIAGRDYYFLDRQEFLHLLAKNAFCEHSTVHGQHLYGLTWAEVRRHIERGVDILLTVDVQGAAKLQRLAMDDATGYLNGRVVTIFLLPPADEELCSRILCRGPLDEGELERRMRSAHCEIELADCYDYAIPSGTAEETLCRMLNIHAAEKMRNRQGKTLPSTWCSNLPGRPLG